MVFHGSSKIGKIRILKLICIENGVFYTRWQRYVKILAFSLHVVQLTDLPAEDVPQVVFLKQLLFPDQCLVEGV